MFWAPRLSAMNIFWGVLMMSSSTLLWLSPSLLLWEVAVLRAGWSLGIRRRLTPCFLRVDLRSRPVFWTSR